LFSELEFVEKYTARTMIERVDSLRDQFFSVMPFADGILALAQRLGFKIHLAAWRRTHFSKYASIACQRAVRSLRLDGDELPGENAPRSNQHTSKIALRATRVSAVEGW